MKTMREGSCDQHGKRSFQGGKKRRGEKGGDEYRTLCHSKTIRSENNRNGSVFSLILDEKG